MVLVTVVEVALANSSHVAEAPKLVFFVPAADRSEAELDALGPSGSLPVRALSCHSSHIRGLRAGNELPRMDMPCGLAASPTGSCHTKLVSVTWRDEPGNGNKGRCDTRKRWTATCCETNKQIQHVTAMSGTAKWGDIDTKVDLPASLKATGSGGSDSLGGPHH